MHNGSSRSALWPGTAGNYSRGLTLPWQVKDPLIGGIRHPILQTDNTSRNASPRPRQTECAEGMVRFRHLSVSPRQTPFSCISGPYPEALTRDRMTKLRARSGEWLGHLSARLVPRRSFGPHGVRNGQVPEFSRRSVNNDLSNWTDNRVSEQMMGRDCANWDQSVCQNAHSCNYWVSRADSSNNQEALLEHGS